MKASPQAIVALVALSLTVPSHHYFCDAFIPSSTESSMTGRSVIGASHSYSPSAKMMDLRTLVASVPPLMIQSQIQSQSNRRVAPSSSRLYNFVDQGFGGKDDDDEEDEDEDSDIDSDSDSDAEDEVSSKYSERSWESSEEMKRNIEKSLTDGSAKIKLPPRPNLYGWDFDELERVPDEELAQTMNAEERAENLRIIRQIYNSDLPILDKREDYAGWIEAKNDLDKRRNADPWYGVNDRLQNSYFMGEDEEVERLTKIADALGGMPLGITTVGNDPYVNSIAIYEPPPTKGDRLDRLERARRDAMEKYGDEMVKDVKRMHREVDIEREKEEEARRKDPWYDEKIGNQRLKETIEILEGYTEEDENEIEEEIETLIGEKPDVDSNIERDDVYRERRLKEIRMDLLKEMGKGIGKKKQKEGAYATEGLTEEDFEETKEERKLYGGKDADDDDLDNDYDNDIEASLRRLETGSAAKAREAAAAKASGGRPRLPGDDDVKIGEITVPVESSSTTTSGPITVTVNSSYNLDQSDVPMRKHCFQYTVRITNDSEDDTVQLLSRRFEIQTVGSSMKDVVEGEGVTGRKPLLKPGEVFEYTSTAPLAVRPIGTTIIAARMSGEYRYVTLTEGQESATEEQVAASGDGGAEMGTFHFIFPEEQRVEPVVSSYDDEDDEDEDDDDDLDVDFSKSNASDKFKSVAARKIAEAKAERARYTPTKSADPAKSTSSSASPAPTTSPATSSSTPPSTSSPASSLPGDLDITSGRPESPSPDSSDIVTDGVRVRVSTSYRPERSDSSINKHCFAYNVCITNEPSSSCSIQLVSRKFEIQTIGSQTKDVVQGPGVTGRQPILPPGESFEYTSTAPLSVKPVDGTGVVARMSGEYAFVRLGEDGQTPLSATALQAKMGPFHFILPK